MKVRKIKQHQLMLMKRHEFKPETDAGGYTARIWGETIRRHYLAWAVTLTNDSRNVKGNKTKSGIYWRDIRSEGEINGRWIVEAKDGTLVADPAPLDEDQGNTFTALNGKCYWDTTDHSQWTPRT